MSDPRSNAPRTLPAHLAVRRRELLLLALRRLALAAGSTGGEGLPAALDRALARDAPASAGPDALADLAALLQAALHHAGILGTAEAAPALAHALMTQATEDVAREAQRAGHAQTYGALQPWLQRPLPPAEASDLGLRLGRSADDLQRALIRLRRRFRQRIEAGLALCSADAAQRTRLRRQLHAALSSGESP